jgi:hypothetical protein
MINPKILKTVLVSFFIAVSASALIAQEIERKQNFTNFNGISVSSGIDLYLTQSISEKVVLKGDKDVLDKIKVTKDAHGVLKFEFKESGSMNNWTWGKDNAVKAYVSFKTLNNLVASGGSDVFSDGQFNLSSLSIKSSGGSDIILDLIVQDLKVATSGGSDITLKGRADKFSLSASGGSDVNAFGLEAGDVVATASGGSDAELNASKTISIAASGASDVNYKGSAIKRNISSTGASDVTKVK